MVEIPVKHKHERAAFPLWWVPLALLGLLGGGLVFSRACTSPGVVATTEADRTPVVVDDTGAERAAATGAVAQAAPGGALGCSADQDCASDQLCSGGTCQALAATGACGEARLHFDTGSAAIHESDSTLLDRMARCLRANQHVRLLIEGNADQRGPEELNDQLAERRAMAVAHELSARGVADDQLRIASYGENNPLCAENDEDCWAKNRRAAVRPQTKEGAR